MPFITHIIYCYFIQQMYNNLYSLYNYLVINAEILTFSVLNPSIKRPYFSINIVVTNCISVNSITLSYYSISTLFFI